MKRKDASCRKDKKKKRETPHRIPPARILRVVPQEATRKQKPKRNRVLSAVTTRSKSLHILAPTGRGDFLPTHNTYHRNTSATSTSLSLSPSLLQVGASNYLSTYSLVNGPSCQGKNGVSAKTRTRAPTMRERFPAQMLRWASTTSNPNLHATNLGTLYWQRQESDKLKA